MSTCISRQGEFGDHILDDDYTCTRCLVLDEDALVDELRQARARLAEVEAERDALQRQRDEVWYRIDLWSDDPDTGLDHLLDVWTSHEKALAELEAARPVVEAAVAYENRWRRYAGIEPGADSTEVRLAKGHAHQALLDAVRAAAVDLYRSATSDHPSTTEEKL